MILVSGTHASHVTFVGGTQKNWAYHTLSRTQLIVFRRCERRPFRPYQCCKNTTSPWLQDQ